MALLISLIVGLVAGVVTWYFLGMLVDSAEKIEEIHEHLLGKKE